MTARILLLDCSPALHERLKGLGFTVDSGHIGYATGFRQLPAQIYEYEVIVYNPSFLHTKKDGSGLIGDDEIKNHSRDFDLEELSRHLIDGGATILTFVNHVRDDVDHERAYGWIPGMPLMLPTKDIRVERLSSGYWHDDFLKMPFLDEHEVRMPVRFKLKHRRKDDEAKDIEQTAYGERSMIDVVPLFENKNREVLGVAYGVRTGQLYVLPSFTDNDEVILDFLYKVVPVIHKIETRRTLVDEYLSPAEQNATGRIEELATYRKEADKRIEASRKDFVQAKLEKERVIAEDETAQRILGYYDVAQRQDKVALHYLYKVIDHLEDKYGSAGEAKKVLGNNEGWNTIHKIANASYGDMRHAPKPGEVIKQWSREEIAECFDAAAGIITAYLATLFPEPEAGPEGGTVA